MQDNDDKAREAVEETGNKPRDAKRTPPAGPHDQDRLTDRSKTPGAGALPDEDEASVNPGAG